MPVTLTAKPKRTYELRDREQSIAKLVMWLEKQFGPSGLVIGEAYLRTTCLLPNENLGDLSDFDLDTLSKYWSRHAVAIHAFADREFNHHPDLVPSGVPVTADQRGDMEVAPPSPSERTSNKGDCVHPGAEPIPPSDNFQEKGAE